MRSKNVPQNYLSIFQVAVQLDVSLNTVKRWYQWFEDDDFEKPSDMKLPKYHYFDKKGTKYFEESDLALFKDFEEKLNTTHRGCMAQFNKEKIWKK